MEKTIFEKLEDKGITAEFFLSGHMYVDSNYETSTNCGNCYGANCDTCQKCWRLFKDTRFLTTIREDKKELEDFLDDEYVNMYL